MPHLLDTEVTLLVDSKPLPEYQIEVKGEHEVVCYVPSETGKSFQIRLEDKGPYRGDRVYIRALLEIDGVDLGMSSLRSKKTSHLRTISGVNNEDFTAFQPFYFADLQVSEDGDEFGGDPETLGTISVTVHWARYGRKHTWGQYGATATLHDTAVHEKSKKLTSHRVLLGDPVLADSSGAGRVLSEVDERFPKLKFRFYYANKDLLTAREIIPSTRSQAQADIQEKPVRVPNPKKRVRENTTAEIKDDPEEDGMTAEEKRQLRELQAKAARLEQSRNAKRIKMEVKTEPGLTSRAPLKLLENGVIDLTDD